MPIQLNDTTISRLCLVFCSSRPCDADHRFYDFRERHGSHAALIIWLRALVSRFRQLVARRRVMSKRPAVVAAQPKHSEDRLKSTTAVVGQLALVASPQSPDIGGRISAPDSCTATNQMMVQRWSLALPKKRLPHSSTQDAGHSRAEIALSVTDTEKRERTLTCKHDLPAQKLGHSVAFPRHLIYFSLWTERL